MQKKVYSWALYDWANSAFATTVMAGFFPLFFSQYWSDTNSVSASTFYLGLGNSIASIVVALSNFSDMTIVVVISTYSWCYC